MGDGYPSREKSEAILHPRHKHYHDHVTFNRPAEAAHQRGLNAQRAGDSSRAAAAYKEALRFEPGRVRSLNNLAALLMQQGNLQKAAFLLAQADQQQTKDLEEQALLLNTTANCSCGCTSQMKQQHWLANGPDSRLMRPVGPTWH